MAEKIREVKINNNNINMLPLHNYNFTEKISGKINNVWPSCANVSLYEYKYHIVFCPKYRFRIFKGEIGEYAKQQTYILCRQKDLIEVMELNILEDHVHRVMSIPPKYSVSAVMGYLKGKLSIKLFQKYER